MATLDERNLLSFPLRAYTAYSWTSLDTLGRREMERWVDISVEICRAQNFQTIVGGRLWAPGQRQGNDARTLWSLLRKEITTSDLLIVIYAGPSEGLVTEVSHAVESLVPVIFLIKQGILLGETLRPAATNSLAEETFRDDDDLRRTLSATLKSRAADIRRTAFSSHILRNSEKSVQIGAAIQAARKALGWSREDLARKVGLGLRKERIETIETDLLAANPPLHHLIAIARALGWSLDLLCQPPEERIKRIVREEVVSVAKEWQWSGAILHDFYDASWTRLTSGNRRPHIDEIRAEMLRWMQYRQKYS